MMASFLRFQVVLPIKVYCDNMGTLFLEKNLEGNRTKYLDIRYHLIRDYVRDGVFSVVFVPTDQNKAYPFTKNVNKEIFGRNRDYMVDVEEISESSNSGLRNEMRSLE